MQREIIRFDRGAILRKEMLEKLHDFPNDVLDCLFFEYGDGILFGLNFIEKDQKHFIYPGALKYKGEIFFQNTVICLEDRFRDNAMDDTTYYLCFVEQPMSNSNSISKYELLLMLGQEEPKEGFCYKKVIYQLGKFRDVVTGRNTKENVYGLFASKDMYHFRIPSKRLKIETEEVLIKKGERKVILDYQLMDKMNESESISVVFLNNYILEYNHSRGEKEEKLTEIEDSDSAYEVLNKFLPAVVKYEMRREVIDFPEEVASIEQQDNEDGVLMDLDNFK